MNISPFKAFYNVNSDNSFNKKKKHHLIISNNQPGQWKLHVPEPKTMILYTKEVEVYSSLCSTTEILHRHYICFESKLIKSIMRIQAYFRLSI